MPNETENFNGLSPAQTELLACLAEEAGEIVQAVGKALRHGLDDGPPYPTAYEFGSPMRPRNRDAIANEIGNLEAVRDRLVAAGIIDPALVDASRQAKNRKLADWTHHQEDSTYPRVLRMGGR